MPPVVNMTNPGYAIAYENLGDVYAKLSSQAYNKALQIEGTNPAISPKLALVRQLFNSGSGRVAPMAAATGAASDKPAPAAQNKSAAPAQVAAPVAPPAAAPAAAPAVVTPPAPAAKPPAPAAVNPAPAKPEDNQNQNSSKAIEDAVQNWAEAWSDRNLKGYFASYAKEFEPPGGAKRSAWEEERQSRIMGKSKISVRIESLKVNVSGNKAIAKFRQDYKADGLTVSSRKTLELMKHGERWQITRETVGA